MSPQIEVISGVRSWRLQLEAERSTIGKAGENDIAVDDDATASGLHAVLERFAAGWCVTDLGSSNGTWVNGERIWASRRLRHGDEIRIANLYEKFGVAPGDSHRRAALANEALRRGVISLSELRESE